MQTPTYLSTLNIHSERLEKLVEDINNKFPPQPIHPKENIESIMYKAGQQSVVQYIQTYLEDN